MAVRLTLSRNRGLGANTWFREVSEGLRRSERGVLEAGSARNVATFAQRPDPQLRRLTICILLSEKASRLESSTQLPFHVSQTSEVRPGSEQTSVEFHFI